jgi:peptidoglycan/LPS O-acetylase OafA/YrhL
MNSKNISYNPRIDQIRWLAAAIVFMFHYNLEYHGLGGIDIQSNWLGIIKQGHTGVGLFFTLSGFLFMQIALNAEIIHYSQFIRNRFLRIFPLFFTVFLVATSIGRDHFQPQDIFYLLSTNLGKAPTSDTTITGAAWCISIEVLFYLLFPFLARFTLERGYRYLLKLLVLLLFFKLAAYTVAEKATLMYFSTFVGRFDQFLIGMMAALFYSHYKAYCHRFSPLLLPVTIIAVILNSAIQSRFAPFEPAAKSVFWIFWSMQESSVWATFIIAWVGFDKRLPDWLERGLCHGGKISFSFYLLHMALIHLVMQTMGLMVITQQLLLDKMIQGAAIYAVTWWLATIAYSSIEQPFLLMRKNYSTNSSRLG